MSDAKGGLLISAQGSWGFLPAARVLNETTAGAGVVLIVDQLLLPASLEPPKPKPKAPPPPPPRRKGKIGGGLATDVLVSQGKPAYASSNYGNQAQGASSANDGNLGSLFHSSCGLDGAGPW